MTFRQLVIFVEGDYDDLFFSKIVKTRFHEQSNYDHLQIIKWCKKEKDFVNKYVKSLKSMNTPEIECDYIFVTDLDPPNFECIDDRKEHILNDFKLISPTKIVIVVKEIEGWYLAGITDRTRKKIGVNSNEFRQIDPDSVTKETFDKKIKPRKYSKLEFMLEVLKIYNMTIAQKRNKSLGDFFRQYHLS